MRHVMRHVLRRTFKYLVVCKSTSIRNFFQMRRAGKGFDALNLVLNFV